MAKQKAGCKSISAIILKPEEKSIGAWLRDQMDAGFKQRSVIIQALKEKMERERK